MFTIVLICIFTLKLHTSDAQFPNHMDLQKVGEAIFNNEKFNILKPTTHIVSDYFKEFMLRRENTNFPTKRVFIDNNGLRHFWSGFGSESKSLRKTDDVNSNLITNFAVHKNSQNPGASFNIGDIKIDTQAFIVPYHGRRNSKSQIKKQALRDGDETTTKAAETTTTKKPDEVTTKAAEVTTKAAEVTTKAAEVTTKAGEVTTTASNITTTAGDVTTKAGNVTTKAGNVTTPASDVTTKPSETTTKGHEKKERVVAKTTFFCPYFGVITMAAFID